MYKYVCENMNYYIVWEGGKEGRMEGGKEGRREGGKEGISVRRLHIRRNCRQPQLVGVYLGVNLCCMVYYIVVL